jgi:hypothetical protein
MGLKYLKACVYPSDLPQGMSTDRMPGLTVEQLLVERFDGTEHNRLLTAKLEHCCRKICMMCSAGERALEAEREFYLTTYRDAPVLFGQDAIELSYHLEAFVYFARSSLDLVATIFGLLFFKKKMDSFNDLTKMIISDTKKDTIAHLDEDFVSWVASERRDPNGWLPVLCGDERGRALRDKIAHQTGFPIHYEELFVDSERDYAVVRVSDDTTFPLKNFLDAVRDGVIDNFIRFEKEAMRLYDKPAA